MTTTTTTIKLDATTWATWGRPVEMIYAVSQRFGGRPPPREHRALDRRLRLFCCAAWRRKWQPESAFPWGLIEEEDAVKAAEEFANGRVKTLSTHFNHLRRLKFNRCALMAWRCCWKRADNAARAIASSNHDLHRSVSADLLREVFANPFVRREWAMPEASRSWRTWSDGAVPKIAETIYRARAWGECPILADAVIEAGIEDTELTDHLLKPDHSLGCWAVDLLRGLTP